MRKGSDESPKDIGQKISQVFQQMGGHAKILKILDAAFRGQFSPVRKGERR